MSDQGERVMSASQSNGSVQERLNVFLSSLYSTLDIDRLLANYLASVTTLIPAPSYALYLLDPSSGHPLRVAAQGVDEQFLTMYEKRARWCDPILRRAAAERTPVHDGLLTRNEWQGSPLRDVLGGRQLESVLEAPIMAGDQMLGTLNFARKGEQGQFDDSDIEVADEVARHTSVALHHSLEVDRMRAQQRVAESVLEVAGNAVILTDLHGKLEFANSEAIRLFEKCSSDEMLARCVRDGLEENLRDVRERVNQTTRSVRLPAKSLSRHAYLSIRSVQLPVEENLAASFFYAPGGLPDFQHLAPVLTQREIQVLELVAQGFDNGEIADRLTISVNTVKSHLKRMSAKMQVKSRAHLLREATFAAN